MMFKARKMKWAESVARVEEMANDYSVLIGKFRGE
jgi:hypothetical protein